jgi:hypothetical protein
MKDKSQCFVLAMLIDGEARDYLRVHRKRAGCPACGEENRLF